MRVLGECADLTDRHLWVRSDELLGQLLLAQRQIHPVGVDPQGRGRQFIFVGDVVAIWP